MEGIAPSCEAGELLLDLDGVDDHVIVWAIHAVGSDTGDLGNDLLRFLIGDLAEDGVAVGQMRLRAHGDEELGAVGSRAGVCHSQQEWAVELQFWVELVAEFVAWAATAGAGWVAALDHEAIDDAVEDRAIVERAFVGAGCVGLAVFLGALCQANEVSDGLWCVVTKEVHGDIALVGVENCGSCLVSHGTDCTWVVFSSCPTPPSSRPAFFLIFCCMAV